MISFSCISMKTLKKEVLSILFPFIILIALSILLSSCQLFTSGFPLSQPTAKQQPALPSSVPPSVAEEKNVVPPQAPEISPDQELQKEQCAFTADCAVGKECINNLCGTLDDVWNTTNTAVSSLCEKRCQLQKVHIKTSDGEEYTLASGQGSYSYAGALEWKILSPPPRCQALNAVIPFKFISKNTGKILGEEVVAVPMGEESKVVKHPIIARVAFTVKVESVEEKCE